nr:serine protease [Psychromonas sp. SA13A]
MVRNSGIVATPRHVVGDSDNGLVALMPHVTNFSQYQDTSDTSCQSIPATIVESDPIKDIALLQLQGITFSGKLPQLGSFDSVSVSENVHIYGYPHCVEGRRVLTYQSAEIGSKVLLQSHGIKSKYAVINIQSRPGQSGSLIYSPAIQRIVGMLNGAYVPEGGGISLGGINPHELNQTTQCISAQGPNSTVGFGGGGNPEPFYDRFCEEFRKFVCGHESYEQVRQQLGMESNIVKGLCITTISSAIGATLGFAATLLAPAVAALLYLVGQMGVNAWCEVS